VRAFLRLFALPAWAWAAAFIVSGIAGAIACMILSTAHALGLPFEPRHPHVATWPTGLLIQIAFAVRCQRRREREGWKRLVDQRLTARKPAAEGVYR